MRSFTQPRPRQASTIENGYQLEGSLTSTQQMLIRKASLATNEVVAHLGAILGKVH